MTKEIIFSSIIVTLTITVLILLIRIYFLKKTEKYTRERFAFFCVATITTLLTSFIAQIYSSQNFVSAFYNTSNFVFGLGHSTHTADLKDHLITVFVLILFMMFLLKLHKNWNGPISEITYQNRRLSQDINIFSESIIQLKDFFSPQKTIKIHSQESRDYPIIIKDRTEENISWHENVYELLTLYSSQYKIKLTEDYYENERVFISNYGKNNETYCIFCAIDYPSNEDLKNFLSFCKSQTDFEKSKFVVVVKNWNGNVKTEKIGSAEVQFRNEDELLENLVDFSSYRDYIIEQFTSKEISQGSNLTLKDFYVQLSASESESKNEIPKIEEYIIDWLQNNKVNKHLAILAEYGSGKSVLSLKMAYELFTNDKKDNRIPIIIELRGKSPRTLNTGELLANWAMNYRIQPASLMKLHKAGKILLIFEGFDEMDMIGDREMRLNHFQRIWEFAMPNSKIIITGRPNFFLDDKELKTNLGIHKPAGNSHYCEAIYLNRFTKVQIENALRNVKQEISYQILEVLNKSGDSSFTDLISRPSILYLISVIWEEGKFSELKEQINSSTVISEFIKYSYSRQTDKKIFFPLTEKEREYFMIGVAVGMLEKTGYSNQLKTIDLENIILKLYRNFPSGLLPLESAVDFNRKPLKERMIDNPHAEETILTDVRSCGIIVNDLSRQDYFKFAHKSYLEYLLSNYFVNTLIQDKSDNNIIVNAITLSLDYDITKFEQSDATMSFIAEILATKTRLNISEPEKLCRELFKILYPIKFLKRFPKIATLWSLILEDRFFVMNILTLVMVLFTTTLYKATFIGEIHTSYFMIALTSFVVFFTIMITLMKSAFRRQNFFSNSLSRKRIVIWIKCCENLGIEDFFLNRTITENFVTIYKDEINLSYFYRSLLKKFLRKNKLP
jgi:hypothetical protein